MKPVTYTIVKSGIIGMTRYFATYWGACGVRSNCITIAGVFNGQSDEFVKRYVHAVPLGRMQRNPTNTKALSCICAQMHPAFSTEPIWSWMEARVAGEYSLRADNS